MAKTNNVFKNALGGYNKSEVNAYIAAAGAEMKEKEEACKLKVERAERDLALEKEAHAVTSSQLDELGFELYQAKSELDAEKAAHKDASTKLDELAFELYGVKSELDSATLRETELKNAALGLSARIAELENELAQKNDELQKLGELVGVDDDGSELAQKAALYDKLSDRIGEIMLNADSNAELILNGAIERGDELLANAQTEADDIIKAAEEEAKKLRNTYKETANEYYEEVAVFVTEIRDGLEGFMRELGAKRAELEDKIEYMRLPAASPQTLDVSASCTEKDELAPAAQQNATEPKNYSAIDEKIENFFKKTMAAINSFRKKK